MQQLFRLLIFLNRSNMFRTTNSSILRSTFWPYTQLLVQCTACAAERCHRWDGVPSQRSAAEAVHCTKSCLYIQKLLLRMGEIVARKL